MTTSQLTAIDRALEFNRSNPSPLIQFTMKVDPLSDNRHCQELTCRLSSLGNSWEELIANPAACEQLPHAPGLYMFVWKPLLHFTVSRGRDERIHPIPQLVLYVGQTGSSGSQTLRSRFMDEYVNYLQTADPHQLWEKHVPDRREGRLRRFLSLAPLYIWFIVSERREELRHIETLLIRALNPPLNAQGGVKARPTSRKPAF